MPTVSVTRPLTRSLLFRKKSAILVSELLYLDTFNPAATGERNVRRSLNGVRPSYIPDYYTRTVAAGMLFLGPTREDDHKS